MTVKFLIFLCWQRESNFQKRSFQSSTRQENKIQRGTRFESSITIHKYKTKESYKV